MDYKLGRCLTALLSSFLLTGCISNIWTGASLVYNRHSTYKTLHDFRLSTDVNRSLFKDDTFKCTACLMDVAVFNGDILLSGHVPSTALREDARERIEKMGGYRRFFNQLSTQALDNTTLQDNWITAKIRSRILADSTIDPHSFKVVTTDQIVYLMGDVIPLEASQVIQIARGCTGVKRVVKLFKYYNLSDKPLTDF